MDSVIIGIIGIGIMLIFLLAGMPIAFSMAIPGFLGMVYLLGFAPALPQMHITLFGMLTTYSYTVLPFFILIGYFADASGISSDLYLTAEKWLRRLPGGLALATIAGCAGFAGICGSSAATAATMGSIALPEMKRYNYDSGLASGTVAAGGTLGFLIPPSVAFIVYGIMAEQSIGRLLIAGLVPGLLLALFFMALIITRVKANPKLAPSNPEPVSWKEKLVSLKEIWGVLVVFLLVIGGILFGIFTPTEAGGVGAFILFIFALIRRRLTLPVLSQTLLNAATIACMIFFILFSALMFSDFLALSRLPVWLADTLTGLATSRYIVLLIIVLIYLILGCFIESIPMIILTIPVVLPVIVALHFDPVWFGVIVVLMVEAALITPPVGMNVYVIASVAKDIPVMSIFKGTVPFVASIAVMVILLAFFPQIALFLPTIMMR